MGTPYKPIPPIMTLPFNSFPQPVTTISFDPVSDVLWTGLNSGTVTGYCGAQGIRGPSFRVGGSLGAKKIAAGDHYVRALGDSREGLGSWTKGGANKWFYRYDPFFLAGGFWETIFSVGHQPTLSCSRTRPPNLWPLRSLIWKWFF
jgi:PAB-dependent poly(A)-specific ribonuclease subunit 2